MSAEYIILEDQKVVIVRFSGDLNDADLLNNGPQIESHPLFNPHFSELIDFSAVTSTSFSSSAVEMQARRKSIYLPSSKHVVVAPQPHIFGLARMFQVYAEKTKPTQRWCAQLKRPTHILASVEEAVRRKGLRSP